MSEEKKVVEQVPDPELESLLDDAFQDFNKPLQSSKSKKNDQENQPPSNVWTEEFIQQQTKNFEETLRNIIQQQNNPPGSETSETNAIPPEAPPLDIDAMSSEFAKFAAAAANAASDNPQGSDFSQCLSDTMKQLSENNEQLKAPPSADDLTKMFDNFGLMGGEGGETGGLPSLMQTMLENILAKDVFYAPLKEITDKYPDWLADHRAELSPEEFENYNTQFDVMNKIVQLYEEEKEGDTEEVKSLRFEGILKSMEKLQELGQPPKELVGDVNPMALDESIQMMPNPMAFLNAAGLGGGQPGDATNPEQCSIM